MMKLTEKLGKEIWKNAVVVLTCANKFISTTKSAMPTTDDLNEKVITMFNQQLETWKEKLAETFKRDLHLSEDTIANLPIVPAGRRGLPMLFKDKIDAKPWLSKLWMESILVTKRDAQPALIKMNLHRLKYAYASDIRGDDEFDELAARKRIHHNQEQSWRNRRVY